MLANVGQLFKTDKGVSDGEGDGVTLFSVPALPSPIGHADSETLAMRIQEQLDRINEEIWWVCLSPAPRRLSFSEELSSA